MERKELQEKVLDISKRLRTSNDAIVSMSRALVAVLYDAGRQHSAKELERVLFDFDAAMQDAIQLANDNVNPLYLLLMEGMGGIDLPRGGRE